MQSPKPGQFQDASDSSEAVSGSASQGMSLKQQHDMILHNNQARLRALLMKQKLLEDAQAQLHNEQSHNAPSMGLNGLFSNSFESSSFAPQQQSLQLQGNHPQGSWKTPSFLGTNSGSIMGANRQDRCLLTATNPFEDQQFDTVSQLAQRAESTKKQGGADMARKTRKNEPSTVTSASKNQEFLVAGDVGIEHDVFASRNEKGAATSLPTLITLPQDRNCLSFHQVFLRHQIEVFQATDDDANTHVRGRNTKVKVGQVGIRCRHCAHIPVKDKKRGSTYFPGTTYGMYQAAQNMCIVHMQCGLCPEMPQVGSRHSSVDAPSIHHGAASDFHPSLFYFPPSCHLL